MEFLRNLRRKLEARAKAQEAYDLFERGDPIRAGVALEQALELDDSDPVAHNKYGILVAKGPVPDGGDAARHFKRAIELDPENAKYWYNLAESYRGEQPIETCVYLYTISGSLIPGLDPARIADPLPGMLGCSMEDIQPYFARGWAAFAELRRTRFAFFKAGGHVDDFLRTVTCMEVESDGQPGDLPVGNRSMGQPNVLTPAGWFVAAASVFCILAGAYRGFCTVRGIPIGGGDFGRAATTYGPPLLLGGACSMKSLSTDQKVISSAVGGIVVGVLWMAVGFGVGYAIGLAFG